jgi:UDP-N-acetylglucosamine 2-epimerase (non-hydrolysing)
MALIDIIAGARPNFMKIAPIIRAIEKAQASGSSLHYRLIHTGQHYDDRMSASFFEQLNIPKPHKNLEVGSGTQAAQTGLIMTRYEEVLAELCPSACIVVGDVTSAMACAITAQKMHVPVAHVEGGIRSGDWSMPEEINRMVTDSISNWFFTTSEHANVNLADIGVSSDRVFFVGNTMIDTLLANMTRFQQPSFFTEKGFEKGRYLVLTMHRPANVDETDLLSLFLNAIGTATQGEAVIFPVHPRTENTIRGLGALPENIHLVPPQPYLEFNWLVKHARGVITDSGGITEETTVMGIPCITVRDNTERPETVDVGTNEIVGADPAALQPVLKKLFDGHWKKGAIPQLWDGHAGERIVGHLEMLLA